MRYASNVEELLQPEGDLVLALMAPVGFLDFATNVLESIYLDHDAPLVDAIPQMEKLDDNGLPHDEALAYWRITTFSMWQQVDRRMDE